MPWILATLKNDSITGPGICTKHSEHSLSLVRVEQPETRRIRAATSRAKMMPLAWLGQALGWLLSSWCVSLWPLQNGGLHAGSVFQKTRRKLHGFHDLASGIIWHHSHHILLIEATIFYPFVGSQQDPTSWWEVYKRICSHALKPTQVPLCRWRNHGSESVGYLSNIIKHEGAGTQSALSDCEAYVLSKIPDAHCGEEIMS